MIKIPHITTIFLLIQKMYIYLLKYMYLKTISQNCNEQTRTVHFIKNPLDDAFCLIH